MKTQLVQHTSRGPSESLGGRSRRKRAVQSAAQVNRFWAVIALISLATAAVMVAVAVESEFGGPSSPAVVIERRVAAARVALAEDSGDTGARLAIAEAYARAGLNTQAIGEFKAALEVDPSNMTALNGLAQLYEENGLWLRARKSYQLAAESAPEDVEAWSGLGRLAVRDEDFRSAVDYWRRVVVLKPSLADARFQLGQALEQTGRLSEASMEYEEALRYVPDYQAAESGLARVRRGIEDANE